MENKMESWKCLGFFIRFLLGLMAISSASGIPYQRPAVAFFQRPSIYYQPQQGGYPFQQFPQFGGFGSAGFARPAPAGIAQPGGIFLNRLQQGQTGFNSLPFVAAQGQGQLVYPGGVNGGLATNVNQSNGGLATNGNQSNGAGLASPAG